MKELHLKVIPHSEQNYNTIGDYFTNGDIEEFRVSDLGNNICEIAVGLHEIIEKLWCEINGVKNKEIDDFDKKFEKDFEKGLHDKDDEPGDDLRAPYYTGHQIATAIERIFIELFNQSWQEYGKLMMKLWRPKQSLRK